VQFVSTKITTAGYNSQMENKRVTASLALIVLICFFLPWLQVSCGSSVDRLSGVDLARDGHSALWLIPVLMLVVVFLCIARSWKERRGISAVATLVAGLVSVYLMNRERSRFHASSGLIEVSFTAWFWFGLGAAILLVILSALRVLKRTPSN
jgi:hypothetical protein